MKKEDDAKIHNICNINPYWYYSVFGKHWQTEGDVYIAKERRVFSAKEKKALSGQQPGQDAVLNNEALGGETEGGAIEKSVAGCRTLADKGQVGGGEGKAPVFF